jgi:hypothetical protein
MTGVTRIAAHRRPRGLIFGNPCLFSPGIVVASEEFIFPVRAFIHYAEGDGPDAERFVFRRSCAMGYALGFGHSSALFVGKKGIQ